MQRPLGQMAKALSDDVTDTPRYAEPCPSATHTFVQPPLFHEESHDLSQKQRVSVRCVMHCTDNALLWSAARDACDEAGNIRFAQALEREQTDRVLPPQLRQRGAEWMIRPHLRVAIGTEHEEMVIAQRAGDELQQQKGRSVGDLKVVEDEHQRLDGRSVLQKRCCRITQSESRRIWVQ